MEEAKDPDNIWILFTTEGNIVIELDPVTAPNHSQRMRDLTRDDFYDGILWHRVIDGFVAQAGDPLGTGFGGSDLPDLVLEPSEIPHVRGAVSMARAGNDRDSGNSQFFIVYDDASFLDNDYSLFGQVLIGMEVADAFTRLEPNTNNGFYEDPAGNRAQPDVINDALIASDAPVITGTAGADSRALTASDFRIDLGAGDDTLTIAANSSAFTLGVSDDTAGAVGVVTLYGSLVGTNTFAELRNIETIQFADGSFAIGESTASFTAAPDPAPVPEPETDPEPEPGPAPEITPNRVILGGETQTVAVPFAADIVGSAAAETITIPAGAQVSMALNVGDRVIFEQSVFDFTAEREGINTLVLSHQTDSTEARLTLNADADLSFVDRQLAARIGTVGDAVEILLSSAGLILRDTVDLGTVWVRDTMTANPNDGSAAGNRILLSGDAQSLLIDFNADVVSTAAAETLQIRSGATVSTAGNTGDRVEFDIALADATITREGINGLVVETASGGRTTVSLNNPVTLAFTDGSAAAEIGVIDSAVELTLGGTIINDDFDPAAVALDSSDAAGFGSSDAAGFGSSGVAGENTAYWDWLV